MGLHLGMVANAPTGQEIGCRRRNARFFTTLHVNSDLLRRFIVCLIHSILDLEADHVVTVLMVLLLTEFADCFGRPVCTYVRRFYSTNYSTQLTSTPHSLLDPIPGIEADHVGTEQACVFVLACVDGAVVHQAC